MRKAQLNAISRSYTQKARNQAFERLDEMKISFKEYCIMFNYNGSPVALVTAINKGCKKTLANVQAYRVATKERY